MSYNVSGLGEAVGAGSDEAMLRPSTAAGRSGVAGTDTGTGSSVCAVAYPGGALNSVVLRKSMSCPLEADMPLRLDGEGEEGSGVDGCRRTLPANPGDFDICRSIGCDAGTGGSGSGGCGRARDGVEGYGVELPDDDGG